jgi:hypothetical protein
MRALAILFIVFSFICLGFVIPPAKASFGLGYKDWNINTPQKEIEKELKKANKQSGPKNPFRAGLIYFMKGYFSYQKEDTMYKAQFMNAIVRFKMSYTRGKKAAQKAEALQKIGISFYYLKDYENAGLYLRKSMMAKATQGDVWFAKVLIRQQLLDSANNVLKRFCQRDTLSFDSVSHVINVDVRNGN